MIRNILTELAEQLLEPVPASSRPRPTAVVPPVEETPERAAEAPGRQARPAPPRPARRPVDQRSMHGERPSAVADLQSPGAARRAIVLTEVLGPPVSLRQDPNERP